MALTGRQKAAMLLMSLDAGTASELLKGLGSEVVQGLAVELAYLDASGYGGVEQSFELAKEFCNSLRGNGAFHIKNFLKQMLKTTVGEQEAGKIQSQIQNLLQERDPFMTIRSVDAQTIASVLADEHPQAVAVVLSELSAKTSSEVLGLLDDSIRLSAIGRMTSSDTVTAEARLRIAQMVSGRIEAATSGTGTVVSTQQSLRKVAVILRNLDKELRDGLFEQINHEDEETGKMVSNLMLIWEDIPQISDRPLQEALRNIEAQKLALALVNADDAIVEKIKSNISERAAATLEEEASLMSTPSSKDIEDAREQIVQVLRELNEKGELSFLE